MGRRPKPKSDDFFERTPSVIEVIAILCLKPLNNCSTVWEHYPGRKDDAGQTARERDVSRRDGGNISTSARRTTRGQRNMGWQRTKTHRAEEHDVLGGRISGRGRRGARTTTRR